MRTLAQRPQRESLTVLFFGPNGRAEGAWMVTVVLADDHAEARQGLRLLLESDPDFHIVGEAANGLESLRNQLRALASHLLEARESERPTLARELHDEFGQVLTSLQLQLA